MPAELLTTRPAIAPEAIERLRPDIEASREAMTRDRRLPDELAYRMAVEGLFHMFAPQALGGSEMAPLEATSLVEQLAAIDGSAGWAAMIGSQSSWFSAFLPEGVLEKSPLGGPPILAGQLKPGGKATRVEGGFCVSGRWPLASGSNYADYLYGTVFIDNPDAAARPELRIVFVPAWEARVLDTWHTTGLRGTGSNDFVLNELFVPEQRTVAYPGLAAPSFEGPLYRDRYYNLIFTAQGGHALGVARSALESFKELAASKVRLGSMSPLRESPVVRATFAEAMIRIETARAWLTDTTREAWETTVSGDSPSTAQRVALRLAISNAITGSLGAAELLFRAAGSAAVSESSALHRQYQDLLTAAAHVQATPVIFEHAGANVLDPAHTPPPVLF